MSAEDEQKILDTLEPWSAFIDEDDESPITFKDGRFGSTLGLLRQIRDGLGPLIDDTQLEAGNGLEV